MVDDASDDGTQAWCEKEPLHTYIFLKMKARVGIMPVTWE